MKVSLVCLVALLLAGSASAQLRETPREFSRQPLLKGARLQGQTLTRGPLKMTFDLAGGRVAGVLIEANSVKELARGIGATFGQEEGQLEGLTQHFSGVQFRAAAQTGFVDYADAAQTTWLGVKLKKQGQKETWRAYLTLNIWPDSAFPPSKAVTGSAKAHHNIRIFSDFQCPYCQKLWEGDLKKWRKNSSYRVWHYHFPLDSHPAALPTAIAAECAAAQQRFWPYTDLLFAESQRWGHMQGPPLSSALLGYAQKTGLSAGKFTQCLGDSATSRRVQQQLGAGLRLGVQGTPSVFLNGVKLRNPANPYEWKSIQAITKAPSIRQTINTRLREFGQ